MNSAYLFRLPDLSRKAIQNFLLTKLRDDYSWESVHHFRCALSKVLGSAEEWNYIADNPVRKTRLPRREYKSERPSLAPVQVWRLISALQEPARSVAMLLVLTGLRIGELLALRWKSVDLSAQTLRVTATVYEGHSTLQKRSEVPARFHLVQKLFRFSPFFTKGLAILTTWFSRLVRVSPCAGGISCTVICSLRVRS
jgi:integrase